MTLKKAVLRGLMGIPIGVFISTTIGLIYSLVYGQLMVINPMYGVNNPVKVYVIQYVVSMIIGFVFASGSAIFEVDKWSLAKQTVIHFLFTSIVYFPCSIAAGWINFNFISMIIYFLIFIAVYILIWFIVYFSWKKQIEKLNKKLKENQ